MPAIWRYRVSKTSWIMPNSSWITSKVSLRRYLASMSKSKSNIKRSIALTACSLSKDRRLWPPYTDKVVVIQLG
jgi:hypothetical protein